MSKARESWLVKRFKILLWPGQLKTLAKHATLSALHIFWNTILVTLGFIILLRLYPYLPWFGGIQRNTFSTQQLNTTIQDYLNTSDYRVLKMDFHGFGETSYLILSGEAERYGFFGGITYSGSTTNFLILEETQPNPLDKLLFSGTIYKKAFHQQFKNASITYFDTYQSNNNRDKFLFCMNDNICGSLSYEDGIFQILPLIQNEEDECQSMAIPYDIGAKNPLTFIKTKSNTVPLVFFRKTEDLQKELFLSFPTTVNKRNQWLRSTRFQFCIYETRSNNSGCYVTKDRFDWRGYNTSLGSVKDYFSNTEDFYDDFLFDKIDACAEFK